MEDSARSVSAAMIPRLERRNYGTAAALHKHAYHQIVLPFSGLMEIEIAGSGGRVDELQAAFVPDGAVHEFESSEASDFIVLDVPTSRFMSVLDGNRVLDHLSSTLFFPVTARLQCLVGYAASFETRTDMLSVSAAWASLFIHEMAVSEPARDGLQNSPLTRACNFIEVHLAERLSVSQVACATGMSVRSLHSLFRDQLHMTPYAYVMKCRTERALALLENTSKSIGEIAVLTGHADQAALTHSLRKIHGTTPAAFRKQRAGSN